ncbi:hypothetical protein [Bacillus sp. FJAT-52991]|uniref:Fur-regulated basic protein FbpA n=1 Tax=Bacillus kandeliae TaxID=3129297 RepID=A0ABZ2N4P3_9BACI
MKNNYPIASLNEYQLKKIQSLEKELRHEMDENIVLVAYDEREDK